MRGSSATPRCRNFSSDGSIGTSASHGGWDGGRWVVVRSTTGCGIGGRPSAPHAAPSRFAPSSGTLSSSRTAVPRHYGGFSRPLEEPCCVRLVQPARSSDAPSEAGAVVRPPPHRQPAQSYAALSLSGTLVACGRTSATSAPALAGSVSPAMRLCVRPQWRGGHGSARTGRPGGLRICAASR